VIIAPIAVDDVALLPANTDRLVGLTQPAVSRHLRVLRESGFASVRSAGTRRLYALDGRGLDHAYGWLADLRGQWSQRLEALDTELARGRHRTRITSKHEEHAA
jgi:DNA-binding transcriptional ArsR family regulator